jgi:HEPN domain-containing protein
MSELIDEVNKWIEKADHDLGSAKVIYLHLPDYFDTIAFHCQQAVEKYLKK